MSFRRLLWRNTLVTLTVALWVVNVSMATMLWEAYR